MAVVVVNIAVAVVFILLPLLLSVTAGGCDVQPYLYDVIYALFVLW